MANCKPAQSAVSDALISKRFDALLLASASIVWWTNAAGEFVEEQPYWEAYTGQLGGVPGFGLDLPRASR